MRLVDDWREEDRTEIDLNLDATFQRTAAERRQRIAEGDSCDYKFGTSAVNETVTFKITFLLKLVITAAFLHHRAYFVLVPQASENAGSPLKQVTFP